MATGVNHAVVEAIIAMNQGRWTLFGDTQHEFIVDSINARQITGFLLIPLSVPTLELTRDVTLVTTQIIKTNRDRIDGVNCGHRVND